MIPALIIIVATYCIMRLAWSIELARVGTAGEPHPIYSVLSVVAIGVILWQLILVIAIANGAVEPSGEIHLPSFSNP